MITNYEALYCERTKMYDEVIEECGDAKDKIKELEAKLAEAVNKLMQAGCDRNTAEFKLAIATEALEYVQTYKHPDYFSHSRGSIFDVTKAALLKIKNREEI